MPQPSPSFAAVVEVEENLQALGDDLVRLAVLHVGDEADAAGIVLATWVVEALGLRQRRVSGVDARNGTEARLARGGLAPI
jgi:hypothetical protein